MSAFFSIVIIALSIYFLYKFEKNAEKEKQRKEEENRRKAEDIEKEKKRLEEIQINKTKAMKLIDSTEFKKLYDEVNKVNLEFAKKENSFKLVYECYPYSSFTIHEDMIIGYYFVLKIESNFNVQFESIRLDYNKIGVEKMSKEKTEIIAMAFGMSKGYLHTDSSHVIIDKNYWNAPRSVSDIETIYNEN